MGFILVVARLCLLRIRPQQEVDNHAEAAEEDQSAQEEKEDPFHMHVAAIGRGWL